MPNYAGTASTSYTVNNQTMYEGSIPPWLFSCHATDPALNLHTGQVPCCLSQGSMQLAWNCGKATEQLYQIKILEYKTSLQSEFYNIMDHKNIQRQPLTF